MKNKLKALIKKMPLVNSAVRIVLNAARNISFPGSKEFWEKLYSSGGTSGPGSYGKSAESKAGIINSFIKNNEINSVIDFGCGDGNQLSLFDFPSYIGLDVSSAAIKLCKKRFKDDKTKSFFLYDPEHFDDDNSILFRAKLTLALDVIGHLVEYDIFERYMKHLFASSDKFVIIHEADINTNHEYHIKHRRFSKWVEANLSEWKLIKKIKNRPPTNFFIYKKDRK